MSASLAQLTDTEIASPSRRANFPPPGISWPSTATLNPGEGAILYNPQSPYSLTFTGTPHVPVLPVTVTENCPPSVGLPVIDAEVTLFAAALMTSETAAATRAYHSPTRPNSHGLLM